MDTFLSSSSSTTVSMGGLSATSTSTMLLPCRLPFIPAPSSSLRQLSVPSTHALCCQNHAQKGAVERPGSHVLVEARFGSAGGAGVLERPGLDQSQPSQEARFEEGGEMGKLPQRRKFGGGDRYRVLLLNHEKHTESQVASVLPKIVPSVTADEARVCFRDSQQRGAGLVTVTVKEHAEFYAQMMARSGLRSGIEPDIDTL